VIRVAHVAPGTLTTDPLERNESGRKAPTVRIMTMTLIAERIFVETTVAALELLAVSRPC
jgi:hypothetical protein